MGGVRDSSKGTDSYQAPRKRQNSTTSASLSLGYAERRMCESWTDTSETSKHRILMKLDRFQNCMSAVLDSLYVILKIYFEIRNQRHRKPPSTELCENPWVSKILCPPYWVRHCEFRKSDVKFIISDLKSFWVQSFAEIVWFPKLHVRLIGYPPICEGYSYLRSVRQVFSCSSTIPITVDHR